MYSAANSMLASALMVGAVAASPLSSATALVGAAQATQSRATQRIDLADPFNFRADDPVRQQHAVQYMALPDYDWPRLRKEFPEEFENPVDASVVPTDWVPLRVVVQGRAIHIILAKLTCSGDVTIVFRSRGSHLIRVRRGIGRCARMDT